MTLSITKKLELESSSHKLYSQKAIGRIREALNIESIDEIWEKRPDSMKGHRQRLAAEANNL